MRIESVSPVAAGPFLFAEVRTDTGLVGLGECGAWGHQPAAAAALGTFGEYLVGRDPGPIEEHWAVMHRANHFRGAAEMGAIAALDVALWDLKGQALGAPIHALLGGPVRRRVRAYGHAIGATPEALIGAATALAGAGFTAVGHFNPFLDEDRDTPWFDTHAGMIGKAAAVVSAAREALGPSVDLLVELHRRLSPPQAIAFAREIEDARPMFVEDPIPPGDPFAMAEVSRRIAVPVATGERLFTLHEFQALLGAGFRGHLRVSLCLCGGITGARRVAALAEAHQLQVAPHHPLSPVGLAACLHLAASVPNLLVQEVPAEVVDGRLILPGEALVSAPPALRDGFAEVPEGPGLGLALDRAAVAATPPAPRRLRMRRHRDGAPMEQ